MMREAREFVAFWAEFVEWCIDGIRDAMTWLWERRP